MVFSAVFAFVCALAVAGSDAQSRVVNGTDAGFGEFPFIASLRKASSGSHICGASILNDKWLLTAAHCVKGSKAAALNVQYGVTEVSSSGPRIAKIAQVIVHENYQPRNSLANDIAVLRVDGKLQLDSLAQSVRLPANGQRTAAKSPAVLIGWGLERTGGSVQRILQKADLKIVSKNDCKRRHKNQVYSSNICAGVDNGGKGQCNGDSGGPLLVRGQQVGIVSWSVKPCTIPPYPGVYTEVASYINWIKRKIQT